MQINSRHRQVGVLIVLWVLVIIYFIYLKDKKIINLLAKIGKKRNNWNKGLEFIYKKACLKVIPTLRHTLFILFTYS